MLHRAFEKILSDNLTTFINNPDVTIRVRGLLGGGDLHIQIIRDGEVTAELAYVTTIDGLVAQSEFVRLIRTDENGKKVEYEFEEEDKKYLEDIVKYLSRLYVEKDSK